MIIEAHVAEYWRKNNLNPYKLSQEQAENVMRQGYKYPMEERVGTGLKVPEPESYLPKEYIENHANAFEGGASHLETGDSYHQFYENPIIYLNDDFSKDIEVECLKSKK